MSVAHAVGFIEDRVIAWLYQQGAQGGTADECEEALDLCPQTGSARFSELTQSGRIVRTDRRRKTRRGRGAAVHVHPEAASRFAATGIPAGVPAGEPPAELIRPAGSQAELLDSPAVLAAGASTWRSSDPAEYGSAESACSSPTRPRDISPTPSADRNPTSGGQGCRPIAS